ncbi:MAG TPA: ParB/RepB/Spo0J family partition protein [Croceibacterium sp.]|nr:ParB/RepB/Spo0J family partition protein [Propylenella sp.]HYD25215.1 ParB/RepB/Spo0J family partition protein [Croceibacterium sp.]
MQLEHLELSKLVVSAANMRAKRKDRDVAELIPSIRARGVLVPLLVRPNGEPDTYEIVAGRRRYYAAKSVEAEGGPVSVPCAIMESGDDAAALEASLIENVARLNADEVTQWETFARLVKEGRGVDEIAATFGLEERVVRRILALGNLLPRIRTLYRNEQIDAATVRHLTMATVAQQREWLALFDSPDQYAPTGRVLKEWLFGGAAINTSVALFDLAEYTAPIVGDLFDDHRYFSDAALFWTLQQKAVEDKRQAYLAEGWNAVEVMEPGSYFARWEYDKRSQAKGGSVYVVVHESGEVEVHEGFLPHKDTRRADRENDPTVKSARPELSSPLRRYVDLHRHAAVRSALLDHPQVALRLLLAHAIAGSALWTVHADHQRAQKPETEASVRASPSQARFEEARRDALQRLGLDPEAECLVDGHQASLAVLFEALLGLPDEDVLAIVPIVMGEALDASGEMIEQLGQQLAIDLGSAWEADDAFFVLLRDRRVLRELVAELAGTKAAEANAQEPAKALKAIMRDCLAGENGRTKVENWAPRWMRFPATSYLTSQADAAEGDDVPEPELASS